MGCGGSTDHHHSGPATTPPPAQVDAAHRAKYAVFEAALLEDPLHRGGFDDAPPPSSAAAAAAIEAGDAAAEAQALAVFEDAVRRGAVGPESTAGSEGEEPSPFAINFRRSAKVAAARFLHGITDDPDQFASSSSSPPPPPGWIGQNMAAAPDHPAVARNAAIRRWVDGHARGHPPFTSVPSDMSLCPADDDGHDAENQDGPKQGEQRRRSTTRRRKSAASGGVAGVDWTHDDASAAPSDDSRNEFFVSSGNSWRLPTPPNHGGGGGGPVVPLTTFNLLCHDRYGPDAAAHAA